MLENGGDDCIMNGDGYVAVEFGYGTSTEIGQIYRSLAVRCIEHEVKRVLVKPGDADPVGERALRDAFTIIVLAGIAPDFRIAIVTSVPGIEARYRICVRDLRLANVNAQLFGGEEEAVSWLSQPSGSVQRAA